MPPSPPLPAFTYPKLVTTRLAPSPPAAAVAARVADARRPSVLQRFRERRPGTSIPHLLFYEFVRTVTMAALTLIYRVRIYGAPRLPRTGPLLVVANHQSYFDPPMIGSSVRGRQLDYLARSATFKFAPLGLLIRWLNAIPLKEDTTDVGAMRTVLARLGEGNAMLIFPEGGRSPDGRMEPLKRGIAVLMKRARCPIVPVAVEGCYDAWPKGQLLPHVISKRIAVAYGRPISYEMLTAMGPEAALSHIGDTIDGMRLTLRRQLRRQTGGRLPARGPGDLPRR
jgi:1-acyl-sn-glycerol-3-phosphate acyltransferase